MTRKFLRSCWFEIAYTRRMNLGPIFGLLWGGGTKESGVRTVLNYVSMDDICVFKCTCRGFYEAVRSITPQPTTPNRAVVLDLERFLWFQRDGGGPQWLKAWDPDTMALISREGGLSVLRWAREHGCDWDYNVCREAAKRGDALSQT